MSSSIPQRYSPQFTPAPLPIPTRRPTHRANRSLSSSDDGSLDTQSSTNTNSHLMTQYPYQDSDEDPLRHAYIPLPLSFFSCSFCFQGSMLRKQCRKDRALQRMSSHENSPTRRPRSYLSRPSHPPPRRSRCASLGPKLTTNSHPHQHRYLLPQTPHGYHERAPQPNDTSCARFIFVPLLSRYGGAFHTTSRRGSCLGLTSPSSTRTVHPTLTPLCARRPQKSLDARSNAPPPLRCGGIPVGRCHGPGNGNALRRR